MRKAAGAAAMELDMKWESPSWIDIRMDAEIGSYQSDFDVKKNNQPSTEQEPASASTPIDAD
jgi:hypothetical protein